MPAGAGGELAMGRFQTLDWGSSLLQRRLDREGAVATMEVVSGGDDAFDAQSSNNAHADDQVDLNLGPYAVSPLRGLHFSAADDTAAS
jgi:hypothetical protein